MIFTIVIPAYNEERGIADIIKRTLAVKEQLLRLEGIEDVELLVVNDGSRDGTGEVITTFPGVRQIRHTTNKGYGAALKTGFEAARGEVVGFLDADGTYPPEFFPTLLKAMKDQQADMVVGSRMTGEQSGMPVMRYIGNRFFALLLSWIVDKRITDTASGMRVFKKDILYGLYPLPDGLNLTPAMSTRAIHEELRIIEVGIPYDERIGRSKLSVLQDGVRFLRTIVGIAQLYNPLKFFGVIGSVFLLLGLLFSISPISYYLKVRRVEEYEIYRLITIMVLFITGLNIISFGTVSNSILRLIHGREVHADSFWSRFIFRRSLMDNLDKVGFALMALAVLLNYKGIIQYVTTFHVQIHWSYVLVGAKLFLVGLRLARSKFLRHTIER